MRIKSIPQERDSIFFHVTWLPSHDLAKPLLIWYRNYSDIMSEIPPTTAEIHT
jgi:hypothetical protein